MKGVLTKYIIPILLSAFAGGIIYTSLIKTDFVKNEVKMEIILDCDQPSEVQFFLEDDHEFKESNMRSQKIAAAGKNIQVSFDIPFVYNPGRIRIDPGISRGKWQIKKVRFKGLRGDFEYVDSEIGQKFMPMNDIKTFESISNKGLLIESNGNDPFIISTFSYEAFFEFLNKRPIIYLFPLLFSLCISVFLLFAFKAKLTFFIEKKATPEHYFLIIFICILVMPLIWMTLYPKTDTGENRELQKKPIFTFDKIIEYPKKYSKYVEDNFGFKKEYSTLNSYFKLKLFHVSSKPDLVVVGKKSWLFPVDPTIAGDYQNDKLYTNSELKTIQHNLEEVYLWHKSKNIHFYVMIMPIKSNIYPEFLPNSISRKKDFSKLLQLRNHMEQNSFVKIIDLTNEFMAAKPSSEIYYQHDIHMNFKGGYITYQKLINEMKKADSTLNPISISAYKTKFKSNHTADLSRQLSLEHILLNDEWHLEKKIKTKFKYIDAPSYESVITLQPSVRTQLKKQKLPKAIVYRDSFFNLIMPYFSENFRDCIYIWSREMSVEVIEKEKPDFVVYEMLETSIDKLLEDNPNGIKSK